MFRNKPIFYRAEILNSGLRGRKKRLEQKSRRYSPRSAPRCDRVIIITGLWTAGRKIPPVTKVTDGLGAAARRLSLSNALDNYSGLRGRKIPPVTKITDGLGAAARRLEVPPRFELGIRVLQTHALPLGYSAETGADYEARTRYLHLGKVALYQMS